MTNHEPEAQYNRAKPWQLIFFTCNDIAFSTYFFAMTFLSYFITGVVGLSVVTAANLITFMNVFDGITDPIIGTIMDRTSTRFGKFRPFMAIGNITMAVCVLLMFFASPNVPEGAARITFFIVLYVIYIIGYTFQGTATRAGQSTLTNDPKQRPMVSVVSGTGCAIVMVIIQLLVSSYLIVKHDNQMNAAFFQEFMVIMILISGFLTVLAIIGIWEKDRPEYYGLGTTQKEKSNLKLKDYWDIIKGNRGLQMLILAASTDKLANVVAGNSIVGIMVFGIVCGNYSLSGKISLITIIPSMIVLTVGAMFAGRMGQRKAVVVFSSSAIVFELGILCLFIFGNPTQIGTGGFMTVAFFICYCLMRGSMGVPSSLVIPMIADCSDYEIYRTGRYAPGLMGTLFSFVDKVISAFGNTVIGILIAMIGYTTVQPAVGDPLTRPVFIMAMILWCGLPIAAWTCSIIAMKFSPLTREKMVEIQLKISQMKQEVQEP